jgi:hypothetical protein
MDILFFEPGRISACPALGPLHHLLSIGPEQAIGPQTAPNLYCSQRRHNQNLLVNIQNSRHKSTQSSSPTKWLSLCTSFLLPLSVENPNSSTHTAYADNRP